MSCRHPHSFERNADFGRAGTNTGTHLDGYPCRRVLRLDRMSALDVLTETFTDDPARGLRAYLLSVGAGPDAEV